MPKTESYNLTDLDFIIDRLDELSGKMSDPQVIGDPSALADVMREYKRLTPIGEKIKTLKSLRNFRGFFLDLLNK